MFGEDGKVVVGGSDHGVVYVFDRRTGSRLDILRHADAGLVQTIAVSGYTPSAYETDSRPDAQHQWHKHDSECNIELWQRHKHLSMGVSRIGQRRRHKNATRGVYLHRLGDHYEAVITRSSDRICPPKL